MDIIHQPHDKLFERVFRAGIHPKPPISFPSTCNAIRTHLKIRISVQNRGGALFQTGDILEYFEDLKQDANKDIGPKS